MILWALTPDADPLPLVRTLDVADSYLARLKGLQFSRPLAPGHGLVIVPCKSIHTCFVRQNLDVHMIDFHGRVLDSHRAVKPWRVVQGVAGTHAVLELPVDATQTIQPGDWLVLCPDPSLPKSLAFLVRNEFTPPSLTD